eukprot:XP_011667353.1 PREDICTED: uncharacterized protein LOC589174 [Strongylocentrotus purpuratus]
MGVQNLWQILAPVKSEESIESLKGKKIAVDLAIWLVESQVTGMKMMQGRVSKPHLRNLFFRTSIFLRLGVKLVFVIDGTPPELKWEEIARRNEVRLGGGGGGGARGGRGGWRGRGRGGGGGGIVDGCMTEDGDAFLYGARIVYRNLNMATGKVDCYRMDDIETKLDLDRRRLVALAILLGCDYLPKGVPGVGKEVAMRFMKSLPSSVDPLNLFQDWRGGCDSTCLTNEERDVRKFLEPGNVIQGFLSGIKEVTPPTSSQWNGEKTLLAFTFQQFNLVKMEWPIEYTQEKVVPLMTLYDLTHMNSDRKGRLTPATVVKLRVRQGVPCAEVKWHKPEEDKENDEDCEPFYTTVEERELFTSAYPDVMEQFMVAMDMKKAKDNAKVVGRKTHSRETVAGSERPTLPTAGECCKGSSPENIMDQGKSMATEASEINAKRYISHPKDRLKSTPDLKRNQDIKVSKMHTPCHKSTSPATCEVIDLTEDSPLKDQPMSAHSAVHSVEEVEETDHQSPNARALGVQSRSLSEKEGDNNSTYFDEDIPYFQEKPVHERLLQISVSNGNSTYNAKKNESTFMKLDNSLAKFMNELSLVSNSSSLAASFEEIDDSVFIVEDEEPCLDDDKQERTHLEKNNEEKKMEFVNVCQGTVRNVSGKVQESYSSSEVSLGVPEGICVVPEKEVDTKITESELPVQGEVQESTDLRSRETNNFHVVSDSKTSGNLDSLAVTEQACSGKSEGGELLMKQTKNNSGEILDQMISGSLDSSEAAVQETCEPQQDKGVVAHPSISCDVMGNMSPSVHVETKRTKSRKGRIGKTKKMHKLHDSVLIENGLMKILQMMSPVTCLSRSGRRRETSQLSEVAQASEDPCSQTSCLASQNGRPCPELAILSPSLSSSSATASSSFTTSGSTSIVTPNLPGPDVTTTSGQTPLSIPEEPLAILANSATGAHTVSPCTKSSHLLRGQLLSMLSQLTPGDSPMMGAKVLQKPPKFRPPCVGRHGFSSKAKQRIHSESVQDGPKCTPYSDILRESTQTITDQIIGVCESTSVKSNTSLEGTNSPPKVCIGDSSSSIQESRSIRTRAVSTTVDEPRPKPKPRSLSQPSRTVLSVNAKRNRSKHKSCSQPVGSRNRSRSKTSLKGFQRRESMVAMECNLAKILEGLSPV